MPATLDIVGDGRRRLSEIFACAYKLLFRFVRQGLPNVNLTSRILHVYPILFVYDRRSKKATFFLKKEARRPQEV